MIRSLSKFLIALVIVVAIIFVVGYFWKTGKNTNTADLVGFWMEEFPVPSDTSGYYFLEDGRYLYKKIWLLTEEEYAGSSGIWSVENGDLFIEKQREYYFKDDYNLICASLTPIKFKLGTSDIEDGGYAGIKARTITITDDKGVFSYPYVYDGADYGAREKINIIDSRLNIFCE